MRGTSTASPRESAEAIVLTDKASVAAAELQVRTLAATALQEWGPVIGQRVVAGTGLVNRLIERDEFLLQITLPPSVSIDPPSQCRWRSEGAALTCAISRPRRAPIRGFQGLSFFYAADAKSGALPG